MLFKKIISIFKNYKQYEVDENKRISLDLILSEARPEWSLEKRIEWIQKLVKWIRYTDFFALDAEKIPSTKIKLILMVLERNPELKNNISKLLTLTLQELSAVEFFCEVGLPGQIGLIGELVDKVTAKILPKKPIGHQLSELMTTLFPDEEDVVWLKSLDEATLEKISALFRAQNDDGSVIEGFPHLKNDIEESLMYLVTQVVAIGLSPGIRKRIPHKKMKSLPFFYLSGKLNLFLKTKNEGTNSDLQKQLLIELKELLNDTHLSIFEVYHHLNRFGVSTHIVFQLERMKLFLNRVDSLLEIIDSGYLNRSKISNFISELVEQNLSRRHASGILSTNATLLAQKIIENNSQTGEHYIAKNRHEYISMMYKAFGGGILTAGTVYIKSLLMSLSITNFIYGFFSTINYSGSFLFIQFCGFTLATKQPAATASALAQKLEGTDGREGIENLTDEIVLMTRTQVAAVFGNILGVIPIALAVNFIYHYFNGGWIFDTKAAHYTLHTTDILGPSVIYAAFTGFLLWLSSVVAGWADNWYSFHQLNYLITNNKKITTVLSKEGAKKLVDFLDHNITGIAGSISLGFFLGFLPELLKFVSIPLEVRHVTLSTGALAAAMPTLGVEALSSAEFIRAALGILLIGTMNLLVSFVLALFVAFKAKKISTHRKSLVYESVAKRFIQKPFSFFIPKSST
jgi:site-specific recombinase